MNHKRIVVLSLWAFLSSVTTHCFDVNQARQQIDRAVREIQNQVVPTYKALSAGNFAQVRNYFSQYGNPLVPVQAIDFVAKNLGPAQKTVVGLMKKVPQLPAHVITILNQFKAGLGTQVNKALAVVRANAATLDKVNLQRALNALADVQVRDVAGFANDLKEVYDRKQLNLDMLMAQVEKMRERANILQTAVTNLYKSDFVSLLDQLIVNVERFVELRGGRASSEEERQERLDDASNALVAVARKLSGSIREAKPFVEAFAQFAKETIGLVSRVYMDFGAVIWKYMPQKARTSSQRAYNELKANENSIRDVISQLKDQVLKLGLF